MTENEAKAKLCVWAQSQIGYREGGNNWNQYAQSPELARLYGWTPQNQPWCDVFVDTAFISCFGLDAAAQMTYQPMGAGSALCSQSAQYYKDNGAFFPCPEVGDQVFFYASGDINHTGVVVRVDGGSVHTVEGNSADMVAERVYSVGDSKIAGYGRPKWSVVAETETGDPMAAPGNTIQPTKPAEDAQQYYTLRLPVLRRGSTGAAVIAAQFQLLGQGYSVGPDGADGEYGYNTEEAVKEFQLNVHLTADGVVGPDTGARLFGGETVMIAEAVLEATADEAETAGTGVLDKLKNIFRRGKT